MSFLAPEFLFLLLLIPLLVAGAIAMARQKKQAWQKLLAPKLRERLAAPSSRTYRWLSLGCGLVGLALLTFGAAQPTAGTTTTEALIRGRNILIAIDASRSMLARDTAPDRLTAAKAAAFEVLDRFPNDRIGLLAFAGTSSVQAPLTVDHNALRETLDQLDTSNIPTGGSNLAEAVNLATSTLKKTGQATNALIILSDGELHEGELSDASFDARQAGVICITVGLGTEDGDFIPDPKQSDGNFRDREGRAVLTRLNSTPLRTLASESGGIYIEGVGRNFSEQISKVISRLDAYEDEEGTTREIPNPRYQLFLIPALILMIASILIRQLSPARKAKGLPIAAALLLFTPEVEAWNPLESFFGTRALSRNDPEKALESFRNSSIDAQGDEKAQLKFGEASALYKLKRYPEAAKAYSEALLSSDESLRHDAHFQLANTLHHRATSSLAPPPPPENEQDLATAVDQLGSNSNTAEDSPPAPQEDPIPLWQDALKHYDAALEIKPDHQPTIENREVVQKLLDQHQPQDQQQQEQQSQDDPQESDSNEDSEQQENQNNDESQQNQEQNESDQNESSDQQDKQQDSGEENSDQENNSSSNEDQEQSEEGNQSQDSQDEDSQNQEDGQQEQQSQGQSSQQQPAPQRPAPRENETPEEFARRILEQNADFQKDQLRSQKARQMTKEKDW